MKKWLVRIIFGFLFFIPLILQLNPWGLSTWLKGYVRIGTPNEWFGFWGSYIGSILSISFAYINSKFEAKRQQTNLEHQIEQSKINLEHQLEQSKINDLDNAIKKNEINHLTMILGELTDHISNIDSLLAQIEVTLGLKQIMDLETFKVFKKDFADTNHKYQKKWNRFILSYYNSEDKHIELTDRDGKINKFYTSASINILEYEQKIIKSKSDKSLRPKLQEIYKNISDLRKESDELRITVLQLLDNIKCGVKSMQENLNSKI